MNNFFFHWLKKQQREDLTFLNLKKKKNYLDGGHYLKFCIEISDVLS